jgi:hypothetical protein
MRTLADDHALKAENYRRVAEAIEKGNAGEHKIASLLDVLDGAGWVVLNDRYKSANSKTNIDHIIVGPPGVCVIDSKNWSGKLRLDDRGISVGRYRRDDHLEGAEQQAAAVGGAARAVLPSVLTAPVLAFAGDVGLSAPAYHHGVMCLQAEQLLPWLTQQPLSLTSQEVHQLGSALDAAFPPREGPAIPLTLSTLNGYRGKNQRRLAPAASKRAQAGQALGPLSYPNGWQAAGPATRALRQAGSALIRVSVLLIAVVLLLKFGVPMMQKGLTDAIPKIFPTPAASPQSVVAPPKKLPLPASPKPATKR